jgi:hypothetical protein
VVVLALQLAQQQPVVQLVVVLALQLEQQLQELQLNRSQR